MKPNYNIDYSGCQNPTVILVEYYSAIEVMQFLRMSYDFVNALKTKRAIGRWNIKYKKSVS